jgi:hypothetical protein
MILSRIALKTTAVFMTAVMLVTVGPVGPALAEMIGTDQVVNDLAKADDRARVEAFLARDEVRREMEDLGVDPNEAALRAESLTEDEISQIAGRLDEMPAGGQGMDVLLVVLLLLLLIIIIIADDAPPAAATDSLPA